MPITDYKVSDQEYVGHDVASLSNHPSADGIDAARLKERFDAIGKKVIAPKLNGLIDTLCGTETGNSGAECIGSGAIAGVNGSNVREQMADIKGQLDNQAVDLTDQFTAQIAVLQGQINTAVLGQLPTGSVSDDKLSDTATSIKNRVVVLADTLINYSTVKLNMDANGIYTEVQHRRPDNTITLKSVLSGGTSPKYTTRTETKYRADGTTVDWTKVYSLTYDANSNVSSEVLQS